MWIRKLWALVAHLIRGTHAPISGSFTCNFRVLPSDLDLNFHMNNARYVSFMEYGRFDFSLKSGFVKLALKKGFAAVVANQTIVYRRALKPFREFQMETKAAVATGKKSIYFLHKFTSKNELCAVGLVEIRVVKHGRSLDLAPIFHELALTMTDHSISKEFMTCSSSLAKMLLNESI